MAEEFTADELTRSYAEAVDLDARAAEVLEATAVEERARANPCEVWHEIRDFVEAVSNLFFIPRNIRKILKLLIIIADTLCPG